MNRRTCAPLTQPLPLSGERRLREREPYALQVFIAAFTASAVIGSERTRAPTALKMALAIAGATTVTPGSPQPDGGSLLAMIEMSRSGIWLMRIGV